MKSSDRSAYSNRLLLFRRRKAYGRKQVAQLLGHRSVNQLSRVERGDKIPTLRVALKLAIIYDIPVREMLDGYFKVCLREVRMQEQSMSKLRSAAGISTTQEEDICTIAERLASENATELDLDKAARHSIDLIRARAGKLDHF